MISIIICSINNKLLSNACKAIEKTIGVSYEVISYSNTSGSGISEVYNKGIKAARYDLLCFMHEDVIMIEQNWGNTVKEIFDNDTNLGILGVAGSYYKPLTPSGWMGKGLNTENSRLIQGFKYSNKSEYLHSINPDNADLAEVACVDGLWFCVPKKVAEHHNFDEKTFKGFHGYDIDFSLNVGKKYKIAVTYLILLRHLSEGNFDKIWLIETLKLHDKYNKSLPVNKLNLSKGQSAFIEKSTFKYFVDQLIVNDISLNIAFRFIWKQSFPKKFGFNLFKQLNFYLFRVFIGKYVYRE